MHRRERRLRACYEKVGMTYEGTLRQCEFIKGAYQDIKLYAILKSEYRPR